MRKGKSKKLLLVASLFAIIGMVQGCSDDGPTNPDTTFVGSYSGTYEVTAGPDSGESGDFTLQVNSNGTSTGRVTDAADNTAIIVGTTNLSSGVFALTGVFTTTGIEGRADGTLRIEGSSVAGSGTFEIENGNSGTISISRN